MNYPTPAQWRVIWPAAVLGMLYAFGFFEALFDPGEAGWLGSLRFFLVWHKTEGLIALMAGAALLLWYLSRAPLPRDALQVAWLAVAIAFVLVIANVPSTARVVHVITGDYLGDDIKLRIGREP